MKKKNPEKIRESLFTFFHFDEFSYYYLREDD